MSRSHRKVPCGGISNCPSEKSSQKHWHKLWRTKERQRLQVWFRKHGDFEGFMPLVPNEVSNPFFFGKECKCFWHEFLCSRSLPKRLETENPEKLRDYRQFMMK